MVAGSTSETETIESHRFRFLVYGAMACHGPVLIGDMRILGAPTSLKIRDVGPKARAVICPTGCSANFVSSPICKNISFRA
jgi:hypothetical protein